MWNSFYDLKLSPDDVAKGRHREAVGGLWEQLGELQFKWLVDNGLKQHHKLIDVGCGCLRGGIFLINYLDEGNYYGIDLNSSLLNAGLVEIKRLGLDKKRPNLKANGSFDFETFNEKFDFAIAQSVFTHLPINMIWLCLIKIDRVLKTGGKFLATFFEAKDKLEIDKIKQCDETTTHFDRDPYHYHQKLFNYLVEELQLSVQYIGNCNHPRNQKLIIFTKN